MNDVELIKSLGGPTAVARLLGLELPGGSRRVHNWLKRGIPAEIKVQFPKIFLKPARKSAQVQSAPVTSDA